MKKLVLIAIGGFFGAMLRYAIKSIPISGDFPITTLFINTTGCLILALVSTVSMSEKKADIKLGITTGFCGAFTTFSTLCKESVLFMEKGYYSNAILYLFLLILFGLTAAYIGVRIANIWNSRSETAAGFFSNDKVEDEVE